MKARIKDQKFYGDRQSSADYIAWLNSKAGQWVELETNCLFDNQYNTKGENGHNGYRLFDTAIDAIEGDIRGGKRRCHWCGTVSLVSEEGCPKCKDDEKASEWRNGIKGDGFEYFDKAAFFVKYEDEKGNIDLKNDFKPLIELVDGAEYTEWHTKNGKWTATTKKDFPRETRLRGPHYGIKVTVLRGVMLEVSSIGYDKINKNWKNIPSYVVDEIVKAFGVSIRKEVKA